MVTIDCLDPQTLAGFWSTVLEVPVQADYGDFVFLAASSNGGPMLGLQRVPDPTSGKNRVHVDLRGGHLATETPRLLALGASMIAEHQMPGFAWVVLADPEGNQFCIGEETSDQH